MRSYEEELARAKAYADRERQKQEINKIKHSNDIKKPLTFGKSALIFMIINCSIIEIYAMAVMFLLADLSALPGLIAAVVGETATILGYFVKSTLENRIGGSTYLSMEQSFKDKELQTEPTQEEQMDQMLNDLDDGAVG